MCAIGMCANGTLPSEMMMLIGKWSLPHRSVEIETLASSPKSREEIDKSMHEVDGPGEERKMAAPSFSRIN